MIEGETMRSSSQGQFPYLQRTSTLPTNQWNTKRNPTVVLKYISQQATSITSGRHLLDDDSYDARQSTSPPIRDVAGHENDVGALGRSLQSTSNQREDGGEENLLEYST